MRVCVCVWNIGVGAGKCLEVRDIFVLISSNLPETLWVSISFHTNHTKRSSCVSPNVGRQNIGRHFCLYFQVVCPEVQIFCEHFHRFCSEFHYLSVILPGLSTNKNFRGCASAPCTPTSYIAGLMGVDFLMWHVRSSGCVTTRKKFCEDIYCRLDMKIFTAGYVYRFVILTLGW